MTLPNLLNTTDRAQIVERLRRVRPTATPAWGSLDAPRMLCHVNDALRVALGDAPTKPTHTFITRTLVKTLVVNTGVRPPRGKIQTAPEMLSSRPTNWDADLTTAIALVDRFSKGASTAVHPAFGPLSEVEWGRLCWKHIDHHLVQFGA